MCGRQVGNDGILAVVLRTPPESCKAPCMASNTCATTLPGKNNVDWHGDCKGIVVASRCGIIFAWTKV